MSLISITNLTFCYPGSYDNIFNNVSFRIDTEWKLGFVGRNGRGKTTFLNLLLGKFDGEYSGIISASVDFEYFPYPVDNLDSNTLDILNSIGGNAAEWELLRELNLLEVLEDVLNRPFSTLSNGERTKVMLAALFLRKNSFLLIDEPTNHLDAKSRALAAGYLNTKPGFILVSHDRVFLDASVDHILSINRSDIEVQRGNFSSWYRNKGLRDNFERSENERLKKDIKKLEAAARQSGQWADKVEATKIGGGIADRAYIGEQSRRMQQRRKNLERRQTHAIEEKTGLLKNLEKSDDLKLSPLEYHSLRLIEFRSVSVYYGDKVACSDVSFTVANGSRIAITGRNGSGKSSILKLICGENISYTGEFFAAGGLKISYVPQEASGLSGDLYDYARGYGIDIPLFLAILRKLDFARVQFEKPMESFSAGQKKKVLLARSLCEQAHLYLWDEPLNYIDVLSRIQIEELLQKYRPTLLFVEHDRAFCDNIATETVNL